MASVDAARRALIQNTGARLHVGRQAASVLIFIVSLAIFVAVWWAVVTIADLKSYILPSPAEVWNALWPGLTEDPTSRASLLFQFAITFKAAMVGLLVGALAGMLVGMVAGQFHWFERIFMPYVFAIQSTPKIAIAPLIMIWFGFGITSESLLAGILAFFPLVVNTFAGMNMVDREQLRLFAALRARKSEIMVRLRFMTALPLILAGLEIAVVQALLGAVVAEFIAGQNGIGTQIVQFESVSNTAGVFAAIIVLAVAGIALHTIVKFARTKLIFWQSRGIEA